MDAEARMGRGESRKLGVNPTLVSPAAKYDTVLVAKSGHCSYTERPDVTRNLATAVFLSGDTKSSHFRCGNRPMADPTMASGPAFVVSAKSTPAQPLAAARYFAAGDTSVGFTPTADVFGPGDLCSRVATCKGSSTGISEHGNF